MENRIAILGIIVEDRESSGEVNALLHEYGASIIGRMGLPHYRESCSIDGQHDRYDQRTVRQAGPAEACSGQIHDGKIRREWK